MYKIFSTLEEVSHYTARRLFDQVCAKPDVVLGLATGSTMEPVYSRLVECFQGGSVDLSHLTTFNLDEYIGLGAEHAQSYSYYMHQHHFSKVGIPVGRVNLPCGAAENAEQACKAYSRAIQTAGGLDLQLLGIGSNGHIGFNEPYTCFSSRTHIIALSEKTRIDNGRFFANQNEVPKVQGANVF